MLEYALPWLVDHPDEADVSEVEGEAGELILELSVHPDDMGKIIGRRGRVAQALRTVIRAVGAREGVETTVDIVD